MADEIMNNLVEDITNTDGVGGAENIENTPLPDEPSTSETPTEEPSAEEELTESEKHKYSIMRNAYRKLDGLPLGFGLPMYDDAIDNKTIDKYMGTDFMDTMRELRVTVDDIEDGTYDEMMIENRIVYYALKRFRLSASVFFKFSTAVDGKTVDKTAIPKMLSQIIKEYDDEFRKWKGAAIGKLWNRQVSTE